MPVSDEVVVVVGLGEVGKPLLNLLSRSYECVGVDVQPVEISKPCSVLHVCIPFGLRDFVEITCAYISKYKPRYCVVNSTVAPRTTRAIARQSGIQVAYSPVRGKHAKMEADMLHYRKFVAADDPAVTDAISRHFSDAGFKTDRFRTTEVGELSKLLETTWLGVLVGWAQEVERLGQKYGATYDEVSAYIDEIDFLPHVFPGFIGGHCVMPNIDILREESTSDFLEAIVKSNALKAESLKSLAMTTEP
jgi:UDP-N-acetyl-D-mannosaminuronate dehydrogenase